MYHKFSSVILLLTAMLVLWLSAHDWYVERQNRQQQLVVQQLQTGHAHLKWSMNELSDVVTGFGQGWQVQNDGIHFTSPKAAVSMAFGDQIIWPELHQQLLFGWQESSPNKNTTTLLLEFSQVDSGVYYYSPAIKLQPGDNQIDLSSLTWHAKQANRTDRLAWSSLPALNTMVWRFSHINTSAIFSEVEIQQTVPLVDSEAPIVLSMLLNNQLREAWQSQRFRGANFPVMQSYVALPAVVLFLMGTLVLMVAVQIYRPVNAIKPPSRNKIGLFVLLAVLMFVVFTMQTPSMFALLEDQVWLTVVLFVLPVVLVFDRWKQVKNPAWPVWILTLTGAIFMLWMSRFKLAFLEDLPLYLLWAFCQQVVLGPLVGEYLHRKAGLGLGMAALLCGVLFATIHLPNQMLMAATFMAGWWWCYAWLKYQNIYANAVSHALLALLFYQTMPDTLLGTARIGLWF